jgi:hypothetical protein
VRIGRYPGLASGPGVFLGSIDQVRLFGRALAASEVADLHARDLALAADGVAPVVGLTAPPAGAALSGAITVSADAWDAVELAHVQFQLDGVDLGAADVAPPFAVSWNTGTTSDGQHLLRAVARDAAGHSAMTPPVAVLVDNTPPTVALTAPPSGAALRGALTVTATAGDAGAVAGVSFRVDGAALAAEDTTAPYAAVWDTTAAAPGAHLLSAVARDAAGNVTTAAGVLVTVDNVAPAVTVTAPVDGAVLAGVQELRAVASDDAGVAGLRLAVDGVPLGPEEPSGTCALSWNTVGADGPHTVTATARDRAGNATTSAPVTLLVDNQPPTAALAAPAAGARVAGDVTLLAAAADDRAVAAVRFEVDGAPLGGELTAPPYALTWSTLGVATGTHTVTVVVRDAAGNRASSPPVPLYVSRYRYATLADPPRVEARDLAGTRVALFTVGAYTVATLGPTRTLAEQTSFDPVLRSVTHGTWVRLLPAPFGGDVDALWLDEALAANAARAGDVLDVALQYIETAPPVMAGTLQIAGNAAYGPLRPDGTRAEGSDFHDYLGLSWTFAEAGGPLLRVADPAELRSLDCSGMVRMVFGYRGGLPLSFNVQPGGATLPRRANELYESAPGAVVIANAGVQSTAYDRLQPGDTLYWDADPDDGPRLDHVGVYLGVDPGGYHRFISSRKSTNGPTMGDHQARSVLNRTGIYTTAFRAARRF